MKKTSLLIIILLVIFSLSSCQRQDIETNNLIDDVTDESENIKNSEETIDENNQVEVISEWKTAYLEFLKTQKDTHVDYALVHIDNDDIPELYLSGDCEATGDSVCSYKNGVVIEQPLGRTRGGKYVEKSGSFINQNGNMGQYYTNVYRLFDSGFALVFSATSKENVEVLPNGDYNFLYDYIIGEKTVSEDEYMSAVASSFDFEKAVPLHENAVSYEEIIQEIIGYNG
ncbi:MAG: hypothetical protein IJ292_02800 [Clostridia bacterium]|nr:hypothetical protein [Clostridia bacterium]